MLFDELQTLAIVKMKQLYHVVSVFSFQFSEGKIILNFWELFGEPVMEVLTFIIVLYDLEALFLLILNES